MEGTQNMNIQLLFATGNQDKVREAKEIINDPGVSVYSTKELGIRSDPEEDGFTFEENALTKARVCALLLPAPGPDREKFLTEKGLDPKQDLIVVSDDSGLVIDALDGAPGLLSARYMGRDTPYPDKMNHILELMKDVPDEKRTARFVAAIAAVLPDRSCFAARGVMEGMIAHEIRGANGFGYDPFFWLPEYGCTSAEIDPAEKNRISHRGRGIRKMMEILKERYQ